MERNELLERLLELKGKVPLSASEWELINQAFNDPTLKNDLEILKLLDTLEDESRFKASDDAAFLKFQAKLGDVDDHEATTEVDSRQKGSSSWWEVLTKPRKPWGLSVVLAQLALVAIYFNQDVGQIFTDERVETYRSIEQYDPCEIVRVRFKPGITIEQVSEVLSKAGLSILSGPIDGNQYLISRGAYNEAMLNELFDQLGTSDKQACKGKATSDKWTRDN